MGGSIAWSYLTTLTIRYFLSILHSVPEAVDEVILEPDGEWHSEDNKYASSAWMAAHASVPAPAQASSSSSAGIDTKPMVGSITNGHGRHLSVTPPTRSSSVSADLKGKRKAIEILSSDDEDDAPLSRSTGGTTLAPSLRPSRQQSLNRSSSSRPSVAPVSDAIIDLTLSSDDEDDRPVRKGNPIARHPDAGSSRSATLAASSRNSLHDKDGASGGSNGSRGGNNVPAVAASMQQQQQMGGGMDQYREGMFDDLFDDDDELGSRYRA